MRILVTGAYGQLGSEIKELERNYPDWEFIFTDIDSIDITDKTAVAGFFEKTPLNFVVNCAAYTAVDKAETDTETAERVNALAPGILARESKNHGIRMIHISTDYVFAGNASDPYTESDKVDPQGAYGRTKLSGETNVMTENPDSVIIRTS